MDHWGLADEYVPAVLTGQKEKCILNPPAVIKITLAPESFLLYFSCKGLTKGSNMKRNLNGDGKEEIITATATGENVIWSKDADGLFSDTGENVFTWGTESISVSDVNEDGCIDLVITDDTGQEVVFINDCSGHFTLQ